MAGMGSSAFRADLKQYLWKTFCTEIPENGEQFISDSSLDNILDTHLFLKLFFFSLCSDVPVFLLLPRTKKLENWSAKKEGGAATAEA